MTQTLELGLAAEQILINANTPQAQILGGARDRPKVAITSMNSRVTALDLRISIREISTPLPPLLINYDINSISINGRVYASSPAWTLKWQELWLELQPARAQLAARQGTHTQARHQVTINNILVPGQNQTLAQALGTPTSAIMIMITEPRELEITALVDEGDAADDLVLEDISINPQGILISQFSDSSQATVGLVQVPLGTVQGFWGLFSAVPQGYVVCDGTLDTPDLSAEFVINAEPQNSYFLLLKAAVS